MGKYVMSWELRNGAGAEANEASSKRSLAVFSNWTPSDEVNFVEFLSRADGQGGFAVVESDSLAAVTGEISKFVPYFEFHLYPVMDVAEGASLGAEAIAFRDSVS
jgi:hypothetical protein